MRILVSGLVLTVEVKKNDKHEKKHGKQKCWQSRAALPEPGQRAGCWRVQRLVRAGMSGSIKGALRLYQGSIKDGCWRVP